MCLILVSWRARDEFPLVVAANRDEFHARPAHGAAFWSDSPQILAGRDLEAGGTWMGISRGGRFAAVTNYRGGRDPDAKESRGVLVARFLSSDESSVGFIEKVERVKASYSGFNLLVADGEELWWLSNRDGGPRRLEPGTHALGNLLLDTPELAGSKAEFARVLEASAAAEPLFAVLEAAKIVAPDYGTRCSTVLLDRGGGRMLYAERPFGRDGVAVQTARYDLG